MRFCPKCFTYSVTSDSKCLNCHSIVTYNNVKKYGFLDFVRGVALFVSIGICGIAIAFIIYVKFFEGVVV